MKKRLVGLVTVTLALMGCGNALGPSDNEAASAAKAKQALDAASKDGTSPTFRLAAN